MKNFLLSKSSSRRQPSGFALVITLSLMVLLTVIAVGLMSLSAISLRSASRGDAMATARANARLALTIAIGELQGLAGPDQRITATADIGGTATGDQLGAGTPPLNNSSVSSISKGLSALQPGTRHWTGVWKNSNTTTPGTEIYTKTPSPTLLQWLVSGNETNATPKNTPASGAFSVAADGSVSDPKTSVLLVGPGTVDSTSATAADSYVTAPLVEISNAASSGSGSQGRYAWWIGDEGVKARINMVRTENDNTLSTSLVAQRRGWETIPSMAAYPTPGTPGEASLPKVVTASQVSLLDSGATAARQVFHAATSDVKHLVAVGVDLASTANNHSGDFGDVCRRETEKTLDGVGITWSGAKGTIGARALPDGRKLALIGFHTSAATNDVNDIGAARAIVKQAKAAADLVIVSFHGGGEGRKATRVVKGPEKYLGENRGDLVAFTHAVIDSGADLVIGHGPHVLRGLEVYKGRLIAYSLGNFATYGRFNLSGPLKIGAVLEVELAKDGAFVRGKLLPIEQQGEGVPMRDAQARAVKMVADLTRLDFPKTGAKVGADGVLTP